MAPSLDYGGFLRRQLEHQIQQIRKTQFPELHFSDGRFIPSIGDLPPGVADVSRETLTHTGEAAVISGGTTTIPLADAGVSEESFPVLYVAAAHSFTKQDLDSQDMASKNPQYSTRVNVISERETAAVKAVAQKAERLTAFGDPALNFPGFVNHPEIEVLDDGFDPFDTADTSVTDREILSYFVRKVGEVMSNTNMVESPSFMVVGVDLWVRLCSIENTAANAVLLDLLMKQLGKLGIMDIQPSWQLGQKSLEANGVHPEGTGKGRCLIYPLSERSLTRHTLSGVYEFAEPEGPNNMRWQVPLYTVFSPVLVHYPQSCLFVDYADKPL